MDEPSDNVSVPPPSSATCEPVDPVHVPRDAARNGEIVVPAGVDTEVVNALFQLYRQGLVDDKEILDMYEGKAILQVFNSKSRRGNRRRRIFANGRRRTPICVGHCLPQGHNDVVEIQHTQEDELCAASWAPDETLNTSSETGINQPP